MTSKVPLLPSLNESSLDGRTDFTADLRLKTRTHHSHVLAVEGQLDSLTRSLLDQPLDQDRSGAFTPTRG